MCSRKSPYLSQETKNVEALKNVIRFQLALCNLRDKSYYLNFNYKSFNKKNNKIKKNKMNGMLKKNTIILFFIKNNMIYHQYKKYLNNLIKINNPLYD